MQHLWTDQHSSCSQTSSVYPAAEPGPWVSPTASPPRSARFMRKTPLCSSHLASLAHLPNIKELFSWCEDDPLPGTSCDPDAALPTLPKHPQSHTKPPAPQPWDSKTQQAVYYPIPPFTHQTQILYL